MPVNPSLAEHLKSAALFESADSAPVLAAWGEIARTSDVISPLADRADAAAEAARQLALLDAPRATDRHEIPGLWPVAVGDVVNITSEDLNYSAGRNVIVVQVILDRPNDRTQLLVETRL
jgi:hypothetical protein